MGTYKKRPQVGKLFELGKLKEQVDIIIKSLTNEEVLSLCGWDYILEAILSATS